MIILVHSSSSSDHNVSVFQQSELDVSFDLELLFGCAGFWYSGSLGNIRFLKDSHFLGPLLLSPSPDPNLLWLQTLQPLSPAVVEMD